MFYHAMKNEPFITYLASAAPEILCFFCLVRRCSVLSSVRSVQNNYCFASQEHCTDFDEICRR